MGCNCGNRGTTGWVYTAPDGRQTTYRTEVEALAAKVRAGNTGTVKAK